MYNHHFEIWMLRQIHFSQVQLVAEIMTKKGRKKPKVVEDDSDAEIVEVSPAVRTEIVYEDTKAITGADLELKWGHIYPWWLKERCQKMAWET